MYRLIIESLLGFQTHGDRLSFKPCVPEEWKRFKIQFLFRNTVYILDFLRTDDLSRRGKIVLDGNQEFSGELPLTDDRARHHAEIFF